jgi:eukaryotic-like serine/threonine-protein kinase
MTPQGDGEVRPPGSASPGAASGGDQPTRELAPEEIRAASGSGSGGAPARPAFLPPQVVAGRYAVVRFIARGAMGEVYEVEDSVLHVRVALKTIRPEIAMDGRAVERFKREIALARQITHPNVCRVFDIGSHPASEGGCEVPFLTMELLAGESLASRVARKRRLSCAEALPILGQIAAGLEAAHAVGVIHRDLKSGNVMLVGPSGPSRGERAVVTDFGLARNITPSPDTAASISDTGVVVGSPAYMAPEQVEARPLTPAADLYALGIIAYELVTGVRPFDGGSAMTVATRRLTTPPPPPRSVVPDLDPAWENAILKCLALAPEDRFASPGAFLQALRDPTDGTTFAAPVPPSARTAPAPGRTERSLWRRPAVLATALLVLASLGVGALLYGRRAPRPSPPVATPAPVVARRVVAVLPPQGTLEGGDSAWLSTAVGEVLRADLASGGEVRVPPARGDEVALLGADSLVSGTYAAAGSGSSRLLRLDLGLRDAAGGVVRGSASATGTVSQIVDLVTRAAAPLRQALGIPGLTPGQAVQVELSLPRDPEAVRLYAEGLDRLRRGEPRAAVEKLEAAAAIEPRHALTHAALSEGWQALGDEAKARAAARLAASLSEPLSSEDRLALEARLHVTGRNWTKAAESYQALAALHPDDPEARLQLADAQVRAGRPREALVALDVGREGGTADPRLALARARAYMGLGEFPAMRAAARAAADGARAHGAKGTLAQARLAESSALLSLGDVKAAGAAADEARQLFDGIGDRSGSARALEAVAVAVESSGDLGGARTLFERALAAQKGLGDPQSAARILNNLGRLALAQDRVDEAQRRYEESLALFRRQGAGPQEGFVLVNLGAVLQKAGRLDAAEKRYTEALAAFSKSAEKSGLAMALTNLGELAFLRGDLEQARRMHEESLATNREIGERSGQAYDLCRLGEVAMARGDRVVARGRLEESLAAYEALTDKVGRYSTQVSLAQVTLDQGDAARALSLARESEEVLRAAGVGEARARALLAEAEASLALGDVAAARATAEEAGPVAAAGGDPVLRLDHAIVQARVLAASAAGPAVDPALAALTRVAAEARSRGLVQVELRAQLAAGSIERAAGRTAPARDHLRAVESAARARGLGSIARAASP